MIVGGPSIDLNSSGDLAGPSIILGCQCRERMDRKDAYELVRNTRALRSRTNRLRRLSNLERSIPGSGGISTDVIA